jgi:imidazolonepropionase-like amidohydrolase
MISKLGPAREIDVPPGALRIDADGKFLIPGLFDMHIHLDEEDAEEHLKLYLAHGVTTVQSLHGSPWHLELRRRLNQCEVAGPRMFTTGPTTARVGMSTPEEARRLVQEQKAAGYDAIKQYGTGGGPISRETYSALLTAAREANLRVVGHAPRNLLFSVVLEEGQNSIDHMEEIVYTSEAIGEVFAPDLRVQFGRASVEDQLEVLERLPDDARLEPLLRELAGKVKASGLAITPTLISFDMIQAVTTDDIHALMKAPQMRYVHPYTRLRWSPAFNRYRTGGWADKLELMAGILQRSHELQMRLAGAFQDAGIPLMAGTDAPLVYVFPGFSLHQELALLVESGLSPHEALQAATLTASRFLEIDDRVGTISVGKQADFVLLEANPLDDISNTQRIAGVVQAGRWLSRESLDGMLREIEDRYEPLAQRMAPLAEALQTGHVREALELHSAMEEDPDLAFFVEGAVNSLGYARLGNDDLAGALEIFTLNTEYFPEAFNTWDSLAEAYMVRGDDDLAIKYYRRSLELNPGNDNAVAMIERIQKRANQ